MLAAACGSDGESFVTCANDVVVYAGVDCSIVETEVAGLAPEVQDQIAELEAEADADPSTALANGQSIMRLMAAAPFSVCAALQTTPDSDFLTSDTIAPVAEELARTTCPSADAIASGS